MTKTYCCPVATLSCCQRLVGVSVHLLSIVFRFLGRSVEIFLVRTHLCPYYWGDDHPLPLGNNGSLGPSATYQAFTEKAMAQQHPQIFFGRFLTSTIPTTWRTLNIPTSSQGLRAILKMVKKKTLKSPKLTCQRKITMLNRRCIFKLLFFHCHVNFSTPRCQEVKSVASHFLNCLPTDRYLQDHPSSYV